MKKIKVIITGATGMIGESVLDQCIKHDSIENILIINRRPSEIQNPKVKEIVLPNLSEAVNVKNELEGYDACFFCIGVSSIGMDEAKYSELTYRLTLNFAKLLSEINPSMDFCYTSASGSDRTEKGRIMWARVRGKTENDLLKLPFNKVYSFRPLFLIPYLKIKPSQTYQSIKYIKWLLVLLHPIFPNTILKLQDFGKGMINSVLFGYSSNILEVKDIRKLSTLQKD